MLFYSADQNVPKKKQTTMLDFYKLQGSLQEALAKLAAQDGLTFRQIANSTILQNGLKALGYRDIPSSINGVVSKIKDFARAMMEKDKEKIKIVKSKQKLAVVFDEWSSIRGRRFLNVFA